MPRRIYDKIRSIQATRNRATHLAPEETTVDDAIESLKQLGDIAAWYFFKYLGESPADSAEPAKSSEPVPAVAAVLRIAILYKRKTSDEDAVGPARTNRCFIGSKRNFEPRDTPFSSTAIW